MGHKIIHASTNQFEETLKQKIEEKAKYHFENYEGLPYKFLFQNKITGCNNMYGSPFSIDQNEHSFFDYLFSNHLGGLDFIVI